MIVPEMRFLVFEFAVYHGLWPRRAAGIIMIHAACTSGVTESLLLGTVTQRPGLRDSYANLKLDAHWQPRAPIDRIRMSCSARN
eukprot:1832777-Rhodomonas_salina.2